MSGEGAWSAYLWRRAQCHVSLTLLTHQDRQGTFPGGVIVTHPDKVVGDNDLVGSESEVRHVAHCPQHRLTKADFCGLCSFSEGGNSELIAQTALCKGG